MSGPTPVGARFHTSRPLYLGLGKLVDSSKIGNLRSSTYDELSGPGCARQRVKFGFGGERIVIEQHFHVEDRSPAAVTHAVEMAGLELAEQLALEGVQDDP